MPRWSADRRVECQLDRGYLLGTFDPTYPCTESIYSHAIIVDGDVRCRLRAGVMPPMGLRERFETFVRTLDGFESIDALLRNCDPPGKKRADYLLYERQIIVEQKALEVDPIEKPRKFMDDLIEKGRFVLLGGQVSADVIFSKLPDGQKLQRELILRLTRALEGAVSNADKQTADTRDIFAISNAVGVLIILNEKARMLSPEIIHYGLANVFQKTSDDGSLRYPHINGVIVISEAHVVDAPTSAKIFPMLSFTSPHGRGEEVVKRFSAALMEHWANFNGVPLVRGSPVRFRPTPPKL
jgi:hypothetical protein